MKASFYSGKHQGRLTASGEKYDSTKMTAASNKFPLKTEVVVCKDTHCIIVKVNDRINPKYSDRIDLSKEAFKKLANTKAGIIQVMVQEL